MLHRDYYKALGVSKTARQEEIQRAYRRLAQRYHPDVSDSPGAEEKFKEIAAAYAILGDLEKRRKYDRDSKGLLQSQSGLWRPRAAEEAGGYRRYAAADSYGVVPSDPFGTDLENICGVPLRRRGEDREATLDVPLRDARRGGLRTIELVRVERDLDGRPQRVREFLEVEVPRGATPDSLIIVRGHGNRGRGGGADGDLYLRVRIVPDD